MMTLSKALEALKNKDFSATLDLIAQEDPDSYGISHFLIRGLAEMQLRDWAAAAGTFTVATERFYTYAPFWLNRGIAQENLQQPEAALVSYEQCLTLDPKQAEACGNLSNLYRAARRFSEAEDMARRALENGANKGDAFNCLGLALVKQGKFDQAANAFRQGQEATPDNAALFFNQANLEVERLDFDAAWKLFAAARALDDQPVMRHDEGLARLLSGDYQRGWELFESRLEMPRALRLRPPCPRWQGENLQGKKLLIVAEQGFGDVIQFSRYQKFLSDVELVWAVPKALVRLLSGAVRGSVIDETSPLPVCDYYVPILSLPLLTKQYAPAPIENDLAADSMPALPPGKHSKKIGLVWAGSPTHERDYERSIPLSLLEPLISSVEADFYAPFLGKGLDQIGRLPIMRLDTLINDFADTAALLKQMDFLITVDTAVAHLAGALGVRTFLLLPYCPDWRWGVAGQTTQWYPSLTLLRQPHYGDWQSVISNLLERGF